MGKTIGGTIKLEGESEYRKALSTINQQIKTTASELSLLSVQYDKNENSIESYTARNKTLEKEIEQQQQKIALLKGALEDASESYGENDNKTQKYQQSLNKAKEELIKMQREVADNEKAIDEFGKATDDTTTDVKQFSKATENAGENTLKMGDILKANIASSVILDGARALVSVIGNLVKNTGQMITNAAAYADEVLTMSNNTGVAVKTLENYNTVAQLIDVDTEVLTKSMAKNIKSMDSAKDTYKELGVSIKNNDGTLRDSTQVFWESIDALAKVENETQRDVMAMDLFGKSAQDLNSLIKVGSKGFEELSAKAEGLNATLSEKSIKALGEVDDSLQWLHASLENTGKIAAAAFAPTITKIIDNTTEAAGGLNGLLQAIVSGGNTKAAGATLSKSISELLTSAIDGVISLTDVILEPLLNSAFSVLNESAPDVVEFAFNTMATLSTALLEQAPQLLQTVIDIAVQIIETLGQPDVLPNIVIKIAELIPEIVTMLLDNIPLLLDTSITLLMSLVNSLPYVLDELIVALPDVIKSLLPVLISLRPQLMAAAIKLFMAIISAIPEIALTLVENMPLIINSVVEGLKSGFSRIKEIGKDLLSGLWEGIKDKTEWLKQRVREFGQSFLQNIREVFDINSPSRVMRDSVGRYLAEGVGVGFTEEMDKVNSEIKKALPTDLTFGLNASVNSSLKTSYQTNTIEMFKAALSEYKPVIVLDDREVGQFVISTVSKEVFA